MLSPKFVDESTYLIMLIALSVSYAFICVVLSCYVHMFYSQKAPSTTCPIDTDYKDEFLYTLPNGQEAVFYVCENRSTDGFVIVRNH